ncbi:hypothetical protein GCM10009847_15040 [Leucobacter tardus]|uniref:NADH dehydrogenase n=1 Tax=Leucobacter tardus TaxID=501483 RepID=A0A939QEI2_9MICO|nr:complex I subunit 5 family protein [Leucobacter tardus]MBO2989688.1 NADH dehydrogenase [Leucobacter tardus]
MMTGAIELPESLANAFWVLAFGAPLLVATMLAVTGAGTSDAVRAMRDRVTRWAWAAAVPAGALVLLGDAGERAIPWMLFGTTVQLDEIGRPLAGLAALVYGLALAFVPRGPDGRPALLAALMLVCYAANLGVFLAADTVTFYLCFTAMSFTGAALVIHSRSASALRAGRIYLVMTVLGEGAVLAAVLLTVRAGGVMLVDAGAAVSAAPERDLIIGLLIAGFGVKAGTVPLHVWLPLAHPAAPTPASAVLSGVMLKAGLVGWIRFLPLGEETAEPLWGAVLLALALIGGFAAVPVGVLQDDPKVILAYSSISQMGALAALVGVALLVPQLADVCIAAAVVYAVHHGCAKAALFLGVQLWDVERWPRWFVSAVLAVAALSLIGAPLTSGYVAKYGAKEAAGDAGIPWAGGLPVADVLPWIGVGSTLLIARFAWVIWRRERPRHRTPILRGVVWAALGVAAVWPVSRLAGAFAPTQSVPKWFSATTWWDQSWPLLLGLAAALLVGRLAATVPGRRSRLLHPRGDIVPPGDVVAIEEQWVRAAGAWSRSGMRALDRGGRAVRAQLQRVPTPAPTVERAQLRIGTWAGSGAALLMILVAVIVWLGLSGGHA